MFNTIKSTWTSLNKAVTANQRELVLGAAVCTLAGIVLGMLISPRKQVSIGSSNGGNVVDNRTFSTQPDPEADPDEIPF